jgi:hypothetical protein
MVCPLGKNEGNPNSKDSAELQTTSTIKPRTTATEMETTVCTAAGTDRRAYPVKMMMMMITISI